MKKIKFYYRNTSLIYGKDFCLTIIDFMDQFFQTSLHRFIITTFRCFKEDTVDE